MRKLGLLSLLSCLGTLVILGCNEDNKEPYFTRLVVQDRCGVAPLAVEFLAIASGGNEFTDPTGGNLYLEFEWDFGDGQTEPQGSSIAFHTYDEPGKYFVNVTVRDEDGDSASRLDSVLVRADSLKVWLESVPANTTPVNSPVQFNVLAEACGFEAVTGNYGRFQYTWRMDDDAATVYHGRSPAHSFTSADVGTRNVELLLQDPLLTTTRRQTLQIEVTE